MVKSLKTFILVALLGCLFWVGCAGTEQGQEEAIEVSEELDGQDATDVDYADEALAQTEDEANLQSELDQVAASVGALDEQVEDTSVNDVVAAEPIDEYQEVPDNTGVALPVEKAPEPVMNQSVGGIAYMVLPGDTLTKIAKKLYGNMEMWRQIAGNNDIQNPDLIYAGQQLQLPEAGLDSGYATKVQTSQVVSVTVQRGDTLADIAEREIGFTDAWNYIWEQNKNVVGNPHRIFAGQVIEFRQIVEMSH